MFKSRFNLIYTVVFCYYTIYVHCSYQFYSIGTCNNTCASCSSQYPNICTSCEHGLIVQNGSCVAEVGTTIYYQQYFMSNQLSTGITPFDGWQLYSIIQTTALKGNNTKGCINPLSSAYFYFQVLGLYQSSFSLIKTITFPSKIQKLQTFFRVLFFKSPMKVSVVFNDQTVILSNVSESNFETSFNQSDTSVVNPAVLCSMFTYSTASLHYKKFSSNIFYSETNSILTKFTAQYDNDNGHAYWGIRQIVFIATKCISCPSTQIINAAETTGIVIAILIGLLVLLIIPIIVLQKLYIKDILEKKRNIKSDLMDRRMRRNHNNYIARMIVRTLEAPNITNI